MTDHPEPNPVGKIEPQTPLDITKNLQPDQSKFQQYMEPPSSTGQTTPSQGMSPMDLAKPPALNTGPNLENLLAQVKSADSDLSDIRTKLHTPNLTLKRQHQQLLKKKLHDANTHLKKANDRLGSNVPVPHELPEKHSPIERFLGYVTDGQNQLVAAKERLQSVGKEGQLNPSDLLLIQIQLSQAQQELEYSSILLSKVIDIFKQMLNIQL